MEVLYEVECLRRDVTPREFWNYCKREIKKRTKGKYSLDGWIEEYEDWINPRYEYNREFTHEGDGWETPTKEVCRMLPYDCQFYLQKSYNFIMEFIFWEENKGNGYLYIVEFER